MKKTLLLLLVAALAVAGLANAQPTRNDIGSSPESAVAGPPGSAPLPEGDCPPTEAVGSDFTGAPTMPARLFRDGVQTTCANKTFPGTISGTNNYEVFSYRNCGPAACITVNFNPAPGTGNDCAAGFNAHALVYENDFDPNNLATGFLGDVGSSDVLPFQVTVGADSNFAVVVHTNFGPVVCNYEFTIVDVPCQTNPGLCGSILEIPTLDAKALVLLGLLLAAAAVALLKLRG